MSNSSASSLTRTTGSNRFYSPPVFRKNQRQQQRRFGSGAVEPHSKTASDELTLSETSNLDRLLAALTPSVPAQSSCEPRMKGRKTGESSTGSYFRLEDLWEAFREWSAYGAEVPVIGDGGVDEATKMYYVPSLSAMQLYALSTRRLGEEDNNGAGSNNETSNSPGQLVYEYLVSILASEFPFLKKYRSCDISPFSWFSVAWYPIYRIPVGSSLKRVDACFLTFHSLSMSVHYPMISQPLSHPCRGGRKVHGVEGSLDISLHPFALASYKLRGSILAPNRDSEWQKLDSLLQDAGVWLHTLQVKHPDYQYFVNRSSH
uniref:Uncharacterized protein n=1 Tax=Cajanus cajan TaxID=3821 RepID=A0A151QMM8_CAJCA|nr:hypothetical protein KK1_048049 [Cajanus cajan]